MAYFKIGNRDYSAYVSALNVSKVNNYSAQTNAAGNTVVDYINSKRKIEVTIIPLDAAMMAQLHNDLDAFNVSITFLNPKTRALESGVNCIIEDYDTDYYTIQANKVRFKEIQLTFIEL